MTWIENAINHGGILTVSKTETGIIATMNWLHLMTCISGKPGGNLAYALESLEDSLLDDAASECTL